MKILFYFCLFTFAFVTRAFAVPAFDAASVISGESITSISSTVTTSGSNRFMLGCSFTTGAEVTLDDFSYNSVLGTSVNTVLAPSITSSMWRLTAPTTGSNTYQFTFSGLADVTAAVMSFTGVHQTTPIGTAVTQGTSAVTDATVTVTSATDGLVADCFGLQYAGGSHTLGGGQTSRWTETDSTTNTFSGSTKAGAASVTMTRAWDGTYQYIGLLAVPLNPAAAAVGRRQVRTMVIQ